MISQGKYSTRDILIDLTVLKKKKDLKQNKSMTLLKCQTDCKRKRLTLIN